MSFSRINLRFLDDTKVCPPFAAVTDTLRRFVNSKYEKKRYFFIFISN